MREKDLTTIIDAIKAVDGSFGCIKRYEDHLTENMCLSKSVSYAFLTGWYREMLFDLIHLIGEERVIEMIAERSRGERDTQDDVSSSLGCAM